MSAAITQDALDQLFTDARTHNVSRNAHASGVDRSAFAPELVMIASRLAVELNSQAANTRTRIQVHFKMYWDC